MNTGIINLFGLISTPDGQLPDAIPNIPLLAPHEAPAHCWVGMTGSRAMVHLARWRQEQARLHRNPHTQTVVVRVDVGAVLPGKASCADLAAGLRLLNLARVQTDLLGRITQVLHDALVRMNLPTNKRLLDIIAEYPPVLNLLREHPDFAGVDVILWQEAMGHLPVMQFGAVFNPEVVIETSLPHHPGLRLPLAGLDAPARVRLP